MLNLSFLNHVAFSSAAHEPYLPLAVWLALGLWPQHESSCLPERAISPAQGRGYLGQPSREIWTGMFWG